MRKNRKKVAYSEDSLKKRYLFKVISSIFGLLSNVVIYSIVPRALGPASYGNFNFLSHFFSQLVEILDGRSSVGALVKASQRPNEKGLVVSYLLYMFFVSSLLFLGILISYAFGIHKMIWPEQKMENILLAAIWGLFIWYHGILHKLCDAYGFTVLAEKVRVFQKLFAVVLIVLFYYFNYLTLKSFFFYYICTLIILIFGFLWVLVRHDKFPNTKDFFTLPLESAKDYLKEYYTYTIPLLMFISLEALMAIMDRWLLQYSSGSQEQGFFSLGFQIGAISVLFVSSISPLIEREFSIAYGNRDFAQLRYLFRRYIPMLFSFSAYFSCFVLFHAENVIDVFAGDKYKESLVVIVTMSMFPIFFTFGRVLSSIFFATGQNILYRNLGFVFFLGGSVLSYILIAPKEYGGMQLGAFGLSIKVVAVYGTLVISQFYYCCKILSISPWSYWMNQLLIVGLFLLFSFTSFGLLDFYPGSSVLMKVLLGGVLYTLLVALLVIVFPRIVGLTNADITDLIETLYRTRNRENRYEKINLPELSLEIGGSKKIMMLSARSSIHTVKWVNGLAENGHEVILVSMHDGGDPLSDRVKHYKLPWKAPMGYFCNLPHFKKLLKLEKPDILHVHFVSGYGTMGSLSGFQPRVVSVWGTDIFNFPYLSQINKALIFYNLKTARWICSTSWVMARQTCKIYRGAMNNMTVTPFGIELKRFSKIKPTVKKKKLTIGTIKALMDRYGIDTLLKGFAIARSRLIEIDQTWSGRLELIVCGRGPQEYFLKNLAENLQIAHCTEFKGFVPHSEVPAQLNELDIYVAMSREESFGVAIIEASACELPVVVSNSGGLPEVVSDGVTGFVVAENTEGALADKLVQLALDDDLREAMGRRGRERVEKIFRWEDNVNIMERVYNHILKRKS